MQWLQLSLECRRDDVEAWSDALTEAGAAAISLEDSKSQKIFEDNPEHKPLWDNINIIALFPEGLDPLLIQQQLASSIDPGALLQASWKSIVDQDWLHKWHENMAPMLFGDKLWIVPSWCQIPDPTALNISLDPEMAFGTGSHATTALCLEWIAQHMIHDATVIDYGCGSGILAIAAAKLGASKIYAVDIDPISIDVTNSNAAKNNIPKDTIITCLPKHMPTIKADIVIANILANPLIELAPTLAAFLNPGGSIVLSGLLAEQAELIQQRYSEWFGDFTVKQQDEWILITAFKL